MPKAGGSKPPPHDPFPLNTDMVEKQPGKKVTQAHKCIHTYVCVPMHIYLCSHTDTETHTHSYIYVRDNVSNAGHYRENNP